MWAVELSEEAANTLFNLAPAEAGFVSFNLFRLAEEPGMLSRPGASNLVGMIFEFQFEASGKLLWFSVSWQYKRDEILYVVLIGRDDSPIINQP